MTESGAIMAGSVKLPNFALDRGGALPAATIAYCARGKLNAAGDNAVLVAHGHTSGPRMIDTEADSAEGSWGEIVGPGAAIDTERYFVVCPNMLGSSYGSTNAASTNPATGKRYSSTFPELTVADIVRSQWALLDALGVRRLAVVCGVSYGGLLAFQWGIQYPDRVDALVPVLCSPRAPPVVIDKIIASLAQSPHWQGGDYYEGTGMAALLAPMRAATLKGYGIDAVLQRRFNTVQQRATELQRLAAQWAREFDANSLHILMRPLANFDLTPQLRQIRARVLYVLSRSDQLFPPSLAAEVMPALQAAGVRADYFEIDSPCGHFASGVDAALWAPRLREFLQAGRH